MVLETALQNIQSLSGSFTISMNLRMKKILLLLILKVPLDQKKKTSAIGIMSGTMLEEECSIENPVPIIKFHGIDDGVLPYNGSQWYQSVQEVVNFWLDQNNIPNNNLVSSELNGGKVILNQYYGSENNSCLSLYTINEEYDKPGDHVWFSEEIEGNSPNRIMWDFFKENCSSVNSVNIQENQFFLFPNPANHKLQLRNIPEKDYFIRN